VPGARGCFARVGLGKLSTAFSRPCSSESRSRRIGLAVGTPAFFDFGLSQIETSPFRLRSGPRRRLRRLRRREGPPSVGRLRQRRTRSGFLRRAGRARVLRIEFRRATRGRGSSIRVRTSWMPPRIHVAQSEDQRRRPRDGDAAAVQPLESQDVAMARRRAPRLGSRVAAIRAVPGLSGRIAVAARHGPFSSRRSAESASRPGLSSRSDATRRGLRRCRR
jgi:hypothetical protein